MKYLNQDSSKLSLKKKEKFGKLSKSPEDMTIAFSVDPEQEKGFLGK